MKQLDSIIKSIYISSIIIISVVFVGSFFSNYLSYIRGLDALLIFIMFCVGVMLYKKSHKGEFIKGRSSKLTNNLKNGAIMFLIFIFFLFITTYSLFGDGLNPSSSPSYYNEVSILIDNLSGEFAGFLLIVLLISLFINFKNSQDCSLRYINLKDSVQVIFFLGLLMPFMRLVSSIFFDMIVSVSVFLP